MEKEEQVEEIDYGRWVPLYSKMLDSSVWHGTKEVKVLWTTILMMKNAQGIVLANPTSLSKRSELTLEETMEALKVLESPDPMSTTPDEEGRRLIRIQGGWRVVTHWVYQGAMSGKVRREAQAKYMAGWRERKALEGKLVKNTPSAVKNHEPEKECDIKLPDCPLYDKMLTIPGLDVMSKETWLGIKRQYSAERDLEALIDDIKNVRETAPDAARSNSYQWIMGILRKGDKFLKGQPKTQKNPEQSAKLRARLHKIEKMWLSGEIKDPEECKRLQAEAIAADKAGAL